MLLFQQVIMENYTPLFYVDVITHPCPDPYAGLAKPC